jgi:hypothetical protein
LQSCPDKLAIVVHSVAHSSAIGGNTWGNTNVFVHDIGAGRRALEAVFAVYKSQETGRAVRTAALRLE